jgi:hypothetical protein
MRKRNIWSVVLAMVFLSAFAFVGYAEESAHYKLPSPNASFVDPSEMPEFLAPKLLPNRHGIKRGLTEGFMIRQSDIKGGKIVIPPGGLIYFSFGGGIFSTLNGEPINIAGKESMWVDEKIAMAIRRNLTMSPNKPPVPLGEEGSIALAHTFYMETKAGIRRAAFKFVFANGYGTWDSSVFIPLETYSRSQNAIAYSQLQGEGMTTPPPLQLLGDPYNASSPSYVVADGVTAEGTKVKEAGALDMIWFKVSYEKPIIANDMAAGQTVTVGKYQVKVSSVDSNRGTAGIVLLDSQGNTLAEKTLGPLTLETYKAKQLIEYGTMVRPTLFLDYENMRIQLNTKFDDILSPGPVKLANEAGDFLPLPQVNEVSTFHGGKVDLVIYKDVKKMELRRPWSEDPRFILQTAYI